jgi:structural maintenance of chromosome 4
MKAKGQTEHETGLLEYIEDVVGSNRHVEKIAEKGGALETMNEERALKLNRVKAVEGERENLEGAKSEAEDFIRKEMQLCQKRKVLSMVDRAECVSARTGLETKAEEAQGKLEQQREGMQESIQQLEEFEATYATQNREHEEIAAELAQCKSEFAAYERKDVKFREDIRHAKDKEKKLKETIRKENAKVAKLDADAVEFQATLDKDAKAVEKLTATVELEQQKCDEIYESLKGETGALRSALEAKKQELAPLKETQSQHQSQVAVMQSELDLLQTKRDSGTKQLQELQAALSTTSEKMEQLQETKVSAAEEKVELEGQIEALTSEQEALVTEGASATADQRRLRSRVQESRMASDEVRKQGSVLHGLLSAKKDKLPGIEDRLGNLGSIGPKYDVAISTACAGPLNHIVCADTTTAEKSVDYLKKHNLGRATFIMLDKLGYLKQYMKKIDTPEGAPRLFDLVKAKHAKFLPAFYMAMRDTLVADDLEQATRLAYGSGKRWRVVTLEGQLIEASGTMAGGGRQVARGGMKASVGEAVSAEEMAAMETDLSKLSDRCQAIKKREAAITKELRHLNKRLSDVNLTCTKADMGIQALTTQKAEQEARLPELTKLAEASPDDADAEKLSQLQSDIKKATKALSDAAKPAKKLEAEVANLQEQIANVGGKRLSTQKAALAKAEKQFAEVTAHSEKIRGEFKELEEEAFKVMEKYNQAQSLLDAKSAEVQQIQKLYEGLKAKVATVRAAEVDLTNQLEDLNKAIRDCKSREAVWEKTLAGVDQKFAELCEETPDMASEVSLDIVEEELGTYDREDVKQEITRLEEAVSNLKPNMGAIAEYRKREQEYMERVAELDAITDARDGVRREYEDLRKARYADSMYAHVSAFHSRLSVVRLDEFMNGFNKITMKLKEMYQMVTLGGDAELELVDTLDPFSEGIVFSVRPPKKSWKNISNLSGGEKVSSPPPGCSRCGCWTPLARHCGLICARCAQTLSSLALVFALHHFKPTPLYFMDEIDAALDFKNVSIVAHYIKERTKNAQFIIISLRNNMFELADRLVGIYKTHVSIACVNCNLLPAHLFCCICRMRQRA